MDITKLAAEPQLIKIELNNEDLVARYGEVIEFYTWDRQPLETFMELVSATENNSGNMVALVKDFILDSKGNKVLGNKKTLPNDVLIVAVGAIVERLGKL
jgi:hypothetical protein